MASDRELLHVIQDLKSAVTDLNKNYREQGLPVTDGSWELYQFCAQLEFLLQYDLKEKKSLFGQRKDYWDFLCWVLTKLHSGAHAGMEHITSLDKLKTAVGKGRAFIRYCLVHQQLAETLQLCFLEPKVTSEWYYARSPFLDQELWLDILGSLYELDAIAFHLALCRADLDATWPVVLRILPQDPKETAAHSQVEKATSQAGNSNRDCKSHQGANEDCRNPSEIKDHCVIQSTAPSLLRPGLENSMEKWIGVWRSRKNSLLQMSSLIKRSPFMERDAQGSASIKKKLVEVQGANSDLQAQVETEHPSNVFSTQELGPLLPGLCPYRKPERSHQGPTEGVSQWKQQDLGVLMWELGALQQKMSQQQRESTSIRQALSEENRALKEELAKQEEKMEGKEKQQQELTKAIGALREAERKIANLSSECREAWDKKVAAEKSLEEAHQRLSSQEVERRKHLADIEAQELRRRQLTSRCQGLQEKLKMCEESLKKWEAQAVALQNQHGHLETAEEQPEELTCRLAEKEEQSAMLEKGLLREKLGRSLGEIEALEREKETLIETLVSQEQSLVFSKLEIQDLRKELSASQELLVTLQNSLMEQEKDLRNRDVIAENLQGNLNDQLAELQKALEKNTALKEELEEMVSKNSQLEGQVVEQQVRWEKNFHELRSQLGTLEKKANKLEEEKQNLQATLQRALEEKEALEKQVQSTTATMETRTHEATQLRNALEKLTATSQILQKALQENNEIVVSDLKQECLKLGNQVKELELDQMKATNIAEMLSIELEQCWELPTEDVAQQKALASTITVLDLAYETRGEEVKALANERSITERNGRGMAESQQAEKAAQMDVLQNWGKAIMKDTSTKPRMEIHGKCLTSHLDKMVDGVQKAKQMLVVKEKEMMCLKQQLSWSQQDKQKERLLLKEIQQELQEKENKYQKKLSEQEELICSLKGRLVELLREKDALWQKTEGLTSSMAGSAPQISGVCAHCKKDFRLTSRRYQCRLCRSTVCHACSVSSGHREHCCLPCYQERNSQGT
ncbi:PREDICTED: RUN and FYVE domain-containing protein 4 [Gekko japonicus]|uniref:RUN and FYVE domain-containing protein 4 n=1 Tax=Gekko japonicus TaxID=146911 RepID=A0ABM1JVM4_GEKJA|nr:PREDICTED: RUN and FYVE domain-containing protein 4 [Gekko japonicus]